MFSPRNIADAFPNSNSKINQMEDIMAQTTPSQTANLYLLEDLDDASKTRQLANSDLAALCSIADWIKISWPGLTRISAAMGPCVP